MVRFPPSAKRPVQQQHARIDCDEDSRWTIENLADVPLIVNDEPVEHAVLAQNDLIRLGADGPLLRFRLTSGGEKTKSFKQLLLDSTTMANEVHGHRTSLMRAAMLAQKLTTETVHHGSAFLRLGVGLALLGILGLGGWMVYRQFQLDEREDALDRKISQISDRGNAQKEHLASRIAGETEKRERLARELERERAQRTALEDALEKLDSNRREQTQALRALVARTDAVDSAVSDLTDDLLAAKRVHEEYARGVAVIVVGITFHTRGQPGTGVRRKIDPTSAAGRNTGGITVGGKGPIYVEWVTGSGFLARKDGTLVTNRHVVEPWWETPEFGRGLLKAGFAPKRAHLFACFPGVAEAVPLDALANAGSADVALVRCKQRPPGLPDLIIPEADRPDSATSQSAGDKVILLGYPEGVQGLINKLDAESVKQLEKIDIDDLGLLVTTIARLGGIRATLTQGVLSDVTSEYLVYDAVSTRGGSGGPLFSADGRVIGINTAVSEAFAGHNYALHLTAARAALGH